MFLWSILYNIIASSIALRESEFPRDPKSFTGTFLNANSLPLLESCKEMHPRTLPNEPSPICIKVLSYWYFPLQKVTIFSTRSPR